MPGIEPGSGPELRLGTGIQQLGRFCLFSIVRKDDVSGWRDNGTDHVHQIIWQLQPRACHYTTLV